MNRRGILGIIGSIPFVSLADASEKRPKKLDGPIFRSFKPNRDNASEWERLLAIKDSLSPEMTIAEYRVHCEKNHTLAYLESKGCWMDAKVNYEYGLVSYQYFHEKEPNIIMNAYGSGWYEEDLSLFVPPKWTRIG